MRWGYCSANAAKDAGPNRELQSEELRPFTREQVDALADELGPAYGPLVIFAAETGPAHQRVGRARAARPRPHGPAVTVQRRIADGVLTGYPKTERSRRRVPLTARALAALDALPPSLDTPLLFPAPRGGYIGLDTWRAREWCPALDAAGIERRGPYCLRHTFAAEALAAGISIFELARLMGTSLRMIDKTYGHLALDSEDSLRARLDARAAR